LDLDGVPIVYHLKVSELKKEGRWNSDIADVVPLNYL
jgi:hypothetical protein